MFMSSPIGRFFPMLFVAVVALQEWGAIRIVALQPIEAGSARSRALVLLTESDLETFNTVVELIRALGGEVPLAYPPAAMVALLDAERQDVLRRHPAVRAVDTGPIPADGLSALDARAALAGWIWNDKILQVNSSVFAPPALGQPPQPASTDMLIAPPSTAASVPPLALGAPTATQTSEFMAGTIVVSILFVESAGIAGYCAPADPKSEQWDAARQAMVLAKIAEAMDFWTGRSNRPEPLTFAIDPLGTGFTSCEPIARSSADQGRWTADVLSGLGYSATPSNYLAVARAFVHDRRVAYGADWGFLVLVVDSLNDADGSHTDGASGRAYLNGPVQYLTYDNNGWGISQLDRVALHETGHIFGALDEYRTSGCNPTDSWGYLNIENVSCNNGGLTDDVSVMGEGGELGNLSADVSQSARDAIGWRNPIGTVVDVVRTSTISLVRPGPQRTSDARPLYEGVAANLPFPPGGCNRLGNVCWRVPEPVMISKVRTVRWSVDEQPFTRKGVVPEDGSFDGESDGFSFMPPADLTPGSHRVRARAVNHFGHRSTVARDRVRILPQ
jgi:hypothetical protein